MPVPTIGKSCRRSRHGSSSTRRRSPPCRPRSSCSPDPPSSCARRTTSGLPCRRTRWTCGAQGCRRPRRHGARTGVALHLRNHAERRESTCARRPGEAGPGGADAAGRARGGWVTQGAAPTAGYDGKGGDRVLVELSTRPGTARSRAPTVPAAPSDLGCDDASGGTWSAQVTSTDRAEVRCDDPATTQRDRRHDEAPDAAVATRAGPRARGRDRAARRPAARGRRDLGRPDLGAQGLDRGHPSRGHGHPFRARSASPSRDARRFLRAVDVDESGRQLLHRLGPRLRPRAPVHSRIGSNDAIAWSRRPSSRSAAASASNARPSVRNRYGRSEPSALSAASVPAVKSSRRRADVAGYGAGFALHQHVGLRVPRTARSRRRATRRRRRSRPRRPG